MSGEPSTNPYARVNEASNAGADARQDLVIMVQESTGITTHNLLVGIIARIAVEEGLEETKGKLERAIMAIKASIAAGATKVVDPRHPQ
jgi:hypothetical protein